MFVCIAMMVQLVLPGTVNAIGTPPPTDAIPPALCNAGRNALTYSGVTLNFTSDEAGTYYYLVYAATDGAPNAATVKAQGAAAAKGHATAAASANSAAVTGLSASTDYKAYIIVEDTAGNLSAVSAVDFSTPVAGAIPLTSSVTYFDSGKTYTIENTEQMTRLKNLVIGGFDGSGATFELLDNLVYGYWQDKDGDGKADDGEIFDSPSGGTAYTENNYSPIGRAGKNFSGTFDGNGYTVSGIFMDDAKGQSYNGLFAYVSGGTVKNIELANSYICCDYTVGGIVGCLENGALAEYCYVGSGVTLMSNSTVGGIVGTCNSSTVQYCENHGFLASNVQIADIGGIVGSGDNSLIQCCYNSGDVSPKKTQNGAGGIVGVLINVSNTLRNCYNTGDVTGEGDNYGGIAGLSYGVIENSYNAAQVDGQDTTQYEGNIVGIKAFVSGCAVTNCYYDKTVCGLGGIRNSDAAGSAEGKTTSEMQSATAFTGWDTAVWSFTAGKYPQLKAFISGDTAAPEIVSAVRINNTEIIVNLSEPCSDITKNNNGGFTVTEIGGTNTYHVTSTVYGDNPSQVVLTVQNMGASGLKGVLVTYTNGTNGTIVDFAGNALATFNTGTTIASWDSTAPVLVSAVRINDTTVMVQLSEDCLNLAKSNDGGFTVTDISGTPAYTVTATAQGNNASQVLLTVQSIMASCSNGVTVKYTKGTNGTITDLVNKPIETNSVGVNAPAWDTSAPTLVSASRTDDNRLVIKLSESCNNLAKPNDGGFTVTETGGSATYAVTGTRLGDDNSHIVLLVEDMAASGGKGVTVTYAKGANGTITDLANKYLETNSVGVTVPAWNTDKPVVSGVKDGTAYKASVTPTFTVGTATLSKNGGTAHSYTSGTEISGDGSYVLTVTDTLGNSTVIHFIIDNTVPVLSGLTLESVTSAGVSLSFTSNEAASYYVLIYPAGSFTPDADDVVEQAYGATGRGRGAAIAGQNTIDVSGLIAGTDYTAYVVLQDPVDYRSSVKSVNLATGDTVIPLSQSVTTLESGKTYTIESVEQLNRFGALVKAGQSGAGATFVLTEDIVFGYWRDNDHNSIVDDGEIYNTQSGGAAFTATNYTMIGTNDKHFSGTFDARGHSISGLYAKDMSQPVNYVALFVSTYGATIRNIKIENSYFMGGATGAIISRCYSDCTIENCGVESSVSVIGCGHSVGSIVANIDDNGDWCTIQYCYNNGRISGKDTVDYIGGIVGDVHGEHCLVQCCYNTGDVKPEADYHGAGGIAGLLCETNTQIRNCFNTGSVTGHGDFYGGIVGTCFGRVENCYNAALVNADHYIGNIAGGTFYGFESVISGCYYDRDVCAIGGITGADAAGSTAGKTTSEMKTGTAFSGWDTTVWSFKSGQYPQLVGFETFGHTSPTITGVSRKNDTEIVVELNENCLYLTRSNNGGFTVTEKGKATTVYAVTATAKGTDAKHIVLTVNNFAASGSKGVTVTYTKGANGVVADLDYNTLKADSTGFSFDAWDTTPPVVSGVTIGTSYNTDVTPTFTEDTATLSKNGATAVSFTSGTKITAEGSYVLTVTDAAGNSAVIHFAIDKTPPVVSGVTDGASYSDVTPTFTEGTATLSKNGGTPQPFTSGTKIEEGGSYTLTVSDALGNAAVINFVIDKTAPVISAVQVTNITGAGAVLKFTSNEEGTYYYIVYSYDAGGLSADKIIAQGIGCDAKGTGSALAAVNSEDITGLIAGQDYWLYLAEVDNAGNISIVANKAFTTTDDKTELTTDITTLEAGKTYIITTTDELNHLGELVNGGQSGAGATFILGNDITFGYWQDKNSDQIVDSDEIYNSKTGGAAFTSTNYTMIGMMVDLDNFIVNSFSGTFDGRGYQIKGLYGTTAPDILYSALFASVVSGTVKNVGITESYIQGGYSIAAVVGDCIGSTIENCYTAPSVRVVGFGANIGGIVGYGDSSVIQYCYNQGKVSGKGEANSIGGIIGLIYVDYANGIKTTVQYCYNIGDISGEEGYYGISDIGGIVGYVYDYDDSNLIRTGIIITGCYNTGDISASGKFAGGIAGETSAVIENCYNIGAVSALSSYGAITGLLDDSYGAWIAGCYYDELRCVVGGISGADVTGCAEGKSETYMKSEEFLNILRSYSSVWGIDSGNSNQRYPILSGIENTAPTVSGVTVSGTLEYGKTLTGEYTYFDANGDHEGISTYKWYRADDAAGTNKQEISGATSITYRVAEADINHYISFEVAPVASTGIAKCIKDESNLFQVLIPDVTITFDSDEGSDVKAITQKYNTSVTKPADPTKTGNTFAGWYSDEELNHIVTWPYTLGVSNVTFYAKWTINDYTVSFVSNGGSDVTAIQQKYNTQVIKPVDPTKMGYAFTSWCYDSALTQDVAWPYTLGASNVAFYAKWTPNAYSVIYNSNKPSGASGSVTGVTIGSSHSYDVAKALTENGYRLTGYTFRGWSTSSTATAATYTDKQSVINLTSINGATIILYAVWSVNQYSVIYNSNKPSGASGSVTGVTLGSSHTYDTAKTLNENGYALTGYTFIGWSTSSTATAATYTDKQSVTNLSSTDGATVTLYAVWSVKGYSVIYNSNKPSGASGTVTGITLGSSHTYDVAKNLTENGYSLTGYTFRGWSTSSTATAATYTDKQSVINLSSTDGATVTLYAIWSVNKYSAIYNSNKPSGASGSVTGVTIVSSHTYDAAKNLTENGYRLTGYTFLGWSTDSAATVATYTDKQSVTNLSSTDGATITLYAVWSVNQYSVIYNSNKPSGASGSVTGVTIGSSHGYDTAKALTPNGYALTGYTFLGWSASTTATSATYSDEQSVTNLTSADGTTVVLYAVWSANGYSVIYNNNKPSGASGSVTGITLGSSHTYDVAKNLNENGYSLTGYTFLGWSAQFDATTATYTDKQNVSNLTATDGATVTLYAVWEAHTYNVIYNSNKPSGASNSVTGITLGSSHTYDAAKNLTENGYSLTGYTFLGWSTDSAATAATYSDEQSVTNLTSADGATVTLYAVWKINRFTVIFDSNGGGSVGPIIQDYGKTIARPSDPMKYGFTFIGWYSDSGLSNPIIWPYMVSKNVTFYARWSFNNYTISFNSNGGSNVASVTQNYSAYVNKPADPTKTGSVFADWYTDSALTKAVSWPRMLIIDETLYANWTVRQYTVTFNSNEGNSVGAITQDYNTDVTISSAPVKTGYTFIGWNTSADGSGTSYGKGSTFKLIGDITLYALWKTGQSTTASPVSAVIKPTEIGTDDIVKVLGNIKVTIPADVCKKLLGDDATSTLRVTMTQTDDSTLKSIKGSLGSANAVVVSFELTLEKVNSDGTTEQIHSFGEKLKVVINLTDAQISAIKNQSAARLYWYDSSTGKLADMKAVFDFNEKTAAFYTDHFSAFVIAEVTTGIDTVAPNMGNGGFDFNIPVAMIAIFGALIILILKRKDREREIQ